jgi:hypothetical protein
MCPFAIFGIFHIFEGFIRYLYVLTVSPHTSTTILLNVELVVLELRLYLQSIRGDEKVIVNKCTWYLLRS